MRNAMSSKKTAAAIVIGSALLLGATALGSGQLSPDSRVWVEGTSTVRSYRCEAASMESELVTTPAAATAVPLEVLVRAAEVTIAVETLDCANGTMNGHMRKALRMDEHPRITFELDTYTIDGATATLDGTLAMAGRTNPVRIAATVLEEDGGVVRVRAEHELRMTEWGIKPPSLMLGTMKVHDPVTIHFDVALQR